MIVEKVIGVIKYNNEDYKVSTSFHSTEPRGNSNIPRVSNISISLLQKLINKITLEEDTAIIWNHKTEFNDYYKGILLGVDFNKKIITIITMISNNKNKNPEKLFKKIKNRFVIKDIK